MGIVVYNNEPRVNTLTAGADTEMMLVPGRNVVDEDVLEAIKAESVKYSQRRKKKGEPQVDAFQHFVDTGVIVIHGVGVNIKGMSVTDALKAIEMETTVEGVEEFLEQENSLKKPRDVVRNAAQSKIEAIKEAEKLESDERKKREQSGGGRSNKGALDGAGAN
jgi:hypothetical protein